MLWSLRKHSAVPSIRDAVAIDIWQLHKDKVLAGGVLASYSSGDISLSIRRSGTLLIVASDTLADEQAVVLNKAISDASTFEMVTMKCPECGRSALKLYVFNKRVKCKHCHDLKSDSTTRIASFERKLARMRDHYQDYEARKRLGLKFAWVPLGDATRPAHLRAAMARIERRIAMERLKMWKGAPLDSANELGR
jgi:hypothetical protein